MPGGQGGSRPPDAPSARFPGSNNTSSPSIPDLAPPAGPGTVAQPGSRASTVATSENPSPESNMPKPLESSGSGQAGIHQGGAGSSKSSEDSDDSELNLGGVPSSYQGPGVSPTFELIDWTIFGDKVEAIRADIRIARKARQLIRDFNDYAGHMPPHVREEIKTQIRSHNVFSDPNKTTATGHKWTKAFQRNQTTFPYSRFWILQSLFPDLERVVGVECGSYRMIRGFRAQEDTLIYQPRTRGESPPPFGPEKKGEKRRLTQSLDAGTADGSTKKAKTSPSPAGDSEAVSLLSQRTERPAQAHSTSDLSLFSHRKVGNTQAQQREESVSSQIPQTRSAGPVVKPAAGGGTRHWQVRSGPSAAFQRLPTTPAPRITTSSPNSKLQGSFAAPPPSPAGRGKLNTPIKLPPEPITPRSSVEKTKKRETGKIMEGGFWDDGKGSVLSGAKKLHPSLGLREGAILMGEWFKHTQQEFQQKLEEFDHNVESAKKNSEWMQEVVAGLGKDVDLGEILDTCGRANKFDERLEKVEIDLNIQGSMVKGFDDQCKEVGVAMAELKKRDSDSQEILRRLDSIEQDQKRLWALQEKLSEVEKLKTDVEKIREVQQHQSTHIGVISSGLCDLMGALRANNFWDGRMERHFVPDGWIVGVSKVSSQWDSDVAGPSNTIDEDDLLGEDQFDLDGRHSTSE